MKNERIVLCRPRHGFNDMLVHIEKCSRYCRKYKRKLFIDGSVGGFLDDFSNYFVPRDTNISFDKIDFLIPPFDVFPKCFSNDIYNNEFYFSSNASPYTTKDGTPITFDFKKDYKEQILIHSQGGGGVTSILAFARFSLKKDVKLHIKEIIEELKRQSGNKGKYYAIHIRNAGFQTDYKSYFNNIKSKLNKTSFLCTDDYECQQYAKMFFGEKVKSVTDIPDLSSCPIKSLQENKYIERYKTNVDALTDLFILACSEKIYHSSSIGGYWTSDHSLYVRPGILSGYLVLAKSLHGNKRLIKNMLYGDANDSLSYRLAFFECCLRNIFTRIFHVFHKTFFLLTDKGILFTLKFIYWKLLKKDFRDFA